MATPNDSCQFRLLEITGRPLTRAEKVGRRLYGKYLGLRHLAQRLAEAVAVPEPEAPAPQDVVIPEQLGLEPGDWVRVRPLAEIRTTLDAKGRHKGMSFMNGMDRFCGRRLRVLKTVRMIYDEERRVMRKLGAGTVVLEGTYCPGTGVIEGCDRSCMYFWREAWLERADAPEVRAAPEVREAPAPRPNGAPTVPRPRS